MDATDTGKGRAPRGPDRRIKSDPDYKGAERRASERRGSTKTAKT